MTAPTAPNSESAAATAATTTTQGAPEALGEGGIKALQAERDARAESDRLLKIANTSIEELTTKVSTFEDRDKTEIQRAADAAAAAETRATKAESELLRLTVAGEKEITGASLALLTGKTREELEAQADSILALIESAKPQGGPVVPAEGKTPPSVTDTEQQARDILLGRA